MRVITRRLGRSDGWHPSD